MKEDKTNTDRDLGRYSIFSSPTKIESTSGIINELLPAENIHSINVWPLYDNMTKLRAPSNQVLHVTGKTGGGKTICFLILLHNFL